MYFLQFVTGNNIFYFSLENVLHFCHEKTWIWIQSQIQIQSWIRIWICIDLKCWIRISIEINTDPKHCFQVSASLPQHKIWELLFRPPQSANSQENYFCSQFCRKTRSSMRKHLIRLTKSIFQKRDSLFYKFLTLKHFFSYCTLMQCGENLPPAIRKRVKQTFLMCVANFL